MRRPTRILGAASLLLLLGGAFTLECALGPRNEAFDVTGTVITGEDPAQVILYAKGRATASTG